MPLCTPYFAVELQGEIGISTGEAKSLEEILAIIAENQREYQKQAEKYADKAELYRAMQICQAWDTIYDPVMKAPITTVSRIWNRQWGGLLAYMSLQEL